MINFIHYFLNWCFAIKILYESQFGLMVIFDNFFVPFAHGLLDVHHGFAASFWTPLSCGRVHIGFEVAIRYRLVNRKPKFGFFRLHNHLALISFDSIRLQFLQFGGFVIIDLRNSTSLRADQGFLIRSKIFPCSTNFFGGDNVVYRLLIFLS